MNDAAKSHGQQVLESMIADLKKIKAICVHKNLKFVPDPALAYLVANCDLIEFYLRQVYSKTDTNQRKQLLNAHSELDCSAVYDSFYEIAKSPIITVKEHYSAIKLRFSSVTEDQISMLLRALEYAKYCNLDPHDHQLSMSPFGTGLERYPLEQPDLTGEEIQAVRWDVSDLLYSEEKSRVFEECRTFGLEMKEPRDDPRAGNFDVALKNGTRALMDMLKEKTKLDLAAVMFQAPNVKLKYVDYIKRRLTDEYQCVLDALRSALVHLGEYISPFYIPNILSKEELSPAQRNMIGLRVQNALNPFMRDFDNFQKDTLSIQPTAEIIGKVSELLLSNKGGITIMGDVYKNIQNSTIISRSIVEVWNQSAKTIDLTSLAQELSQLRNAMREKASTPEQDMAIGKVATAEKCATTEDGTGAFQHLKDAGKWALDVATEIGTKLASEALKKAIGL